METRGSDQSTGRSGGRASMNKERTVLLLLTVYTGLPSGTLGHCSAKQVEEQYSELSAKIHTIDFRTELHQIHPDFWSNGVDNSKLILETILKKIKSYEQSSDKKWNDLLKGMINNIFVDLKEGDVWVEDQQGTQASICALADAPLVSLSGQEIGYDCRESEQLYGIGYHKVYENCKTAPFLSRSSVDWGVCLHAHYPWVDVLGNSICVMKSYNNDFIACFCSLEDGHLAKRGFCITKFECLLNTQGADRNLVEELEGRPDCVSHIQYFLESNANDLEWFQVAQKKDNLRVRAPYHPESPCRKTDFSALFDIGQLDVDNIEAGIEVYIPFVEKVLVDAEEDAVFDDIMDQDICMPPEMDIPTEQQAKIDQISYLLQKRILGDALIWLPGICFLYSSICSDREERGRLVRLFLGLVQLAVAIIGLYTIVVCLLPSSGFNLHFEVKHYEAITALTLLSLAQIFLSQREVTEFFLKISLVSLLPDIFLWRIAILMFRAQEYFLLPATEP